jgi:hypothetical protein
MSIEIVDPETERLVRELARRMNVAPEEAVRRASEVALAGAAKPPASADLALAEAALKRLHALPVVDTTPAEEILSDAMGDDGRR